jgi:hypothetical protein
LAALLHSSTGVRPPSFFPSLVVCHHSILFLPLFPLLNKLFETKTKRHKERIIDKGQRKQGTGNLLRPHLLFSGSRVTKTCVLQESLLL